MRIKTLVTAAVTAGMAAGAALSGAAPASAAPTGEVHQVYSGQVRIATATAELACNAYTNYYLNTSQARLYVSYRLYCNQNTTGLNLQGYTYRNGGGPYCSKNIGAGSVSSLVSSWCPVYDPPGNDHFQMVVHGYANAVLMDAAATDYYH